MSIDDVLTLLLLVIAAVELGIHIGGRMKEPPPRKAKTATSHAINVFRSWLTRGNGCHLLQSYANLILISTGSQTPNETAINAIIPIMAIAKRIFHFPIGGYL